MSATGTWRTRGSRPRDIRFEGSKRTWPEDCGEVRLDRERSPDPDFTTSLRAGSCERSILRWGPGSARSDAIRSTESARVDHAHRRHGGRVAAGRARAAAGEAGDRVSQLHI